MEASHRAFSSAGVGTTSELVRWVPTAMTWETRRTSATCSRSASASVPRATRAAVSRAEARSSTGRASDKS